MKYLVLLLSFSMLFKPVFPVLNYVGNYNFIANELCENKDKAELNCNGKCYLMKQLAKESETDKPLSSNKQRVSSEAMDLFFCTPADCQWRAADAKINLKPFSFYSSLHAQLHITSIFRPPIANA